MAGLAGDPARVLGEGWRLVEPAGASGEKRGRARAAVLAAAGAALLVYAPSVPNGFLWDDGRFIVGNPYVKDLSHLPLTFTSTRPGGPEEPGFPIYRPLTIASFALDHALYGRRPWGYHLSNVLLHAWASALVAGLTALLVGGRAAPLAAGLLFAVHPAASEAVNEIAARGDVLAAALVLACVLAHLGGETGGGRGRLARAGAHVGYALGLLAKPTAGAAPLALAAIEACARRPRAARAWVRGLAGYLAISAAYAVLHQRMIPQPRMVPYWGGSFGANMAMMAHAFLLYLRLVLWPTPLCARHEVPIHESFLEPAPAGGVVALVLLLALALRARRAAPAVSVGIAWFLAFLLPVANLVPLPGSMMGERFLYLPMVGIAIATAGGLAWARGIVRSRWPLARVRRVERAAALVGALALSLLAARAAIRTRDFHDQRTLMERTNEACPPSATVRALLAQALIDEGRLDEARGLLEPIVEADPEAAEPRANLAVLRLRKGEAEAALDLARQALALSPDRPGLWSLVARAQAALGEKAEAKATLEAGASRCPASADLLLDLGDARRDAGDWDGAEQAWMRAAELDRSAAGPRVNLGTLAFARGDSTAAIEWWREAIHSDPGHLDAIFNLAVFAGDRLPADERRALARRFLDGAGPDRRDERRIAEQIASGRQEPAQ